VQIFSYKTKYSKNDAYFAQMFTVMRLADHALAMELTGRLMRAGVFVAHCTCTDGCIHVSTKRATILCRIQRHTRLQLRQTF